MSTLEQADFLIGELRSYLVRARHQCSMRLHEIAMTRLPGDDYEEYQSLEKLMLSSNAIVDKAEKWLEQTAPLDLSDMVRADRYKPAEFVSIPDADRYKNENFLRAARAALTALDQGLPDESGKIARDLRSAILALMGM